MSFSSIALCKMPVPCFMILCYLLSLFRASDLDHIVYRMGLLAVLRSKFKHGRIYCAYLLLELLW